MRVSLSLIRSDVVMIVLVSLVDFLKVAAVCLGVYTHSCMIDDSSLHCMIVKCTVVYIPESRGGSVGKSSRLCERR